jgi:hypothetical protein
MSGGRKIVGIWPANADGPIATPSSVLAQAADAPEALLPVEEPAAFSPPSPLEERQDDILDLPTEWQDTCAETDLPLSSRNWVVIAGWTASIVWLCVLAWFETRGFSTIPVIDRLPAILATAAAPLALIMLAVFLAERGSERSIQRHIGLLNSLRREQKAMIERVAVVDRHWIEAGQRLEDRANSYAAATLEAGQRIDGTATVMDARMRDVAAQSAQVAEQGEAARRHMDGLLLALPKIEVVARRAADNMRLSGQSAYQYGGQLEAQIAAIKTEASEAEARLLTAETALSERIAAITSATGEAQNSAEALAQRFAAMLATQHEAALAMLADLASTMDTSTGSIEARLATARAMLTEATAAQLAALDSETAQSAGRAQTLEASIADAVARVAALDAELDALVATSVTRVGAMEQATQASVDAVATTLSSLGSLSDTVSANTSETLNRAAAMGGEAAALVTKLEAATHTAETVLPEALQRLRNHVADSERAIVKLSPMIEASRDGAEASLERLRTAEDMLAQQVQTLAAIDRTAAATLASQAGAFADLRAAIEALATRMQSIGEDDAPMMLTHLHSAEVAAAQAADQARIAIDAVVDASAERLRSAFDGALDEAAGETAAARVNQIVESADRAVAAANSASDRLMRQLITIADSSAALEARMGEVSAVIDAGNRDSMARQVAVINESLQSTAVDLTRILSVEVADQAWDAYLKGDRGIFTRRAVRLLNNTEARDILNRYQSDEDFRGLVNRYIRDFEGMLRGLMDTRDGSAVSVTLLSSDIGKTYVALAQAIERLRG